jgi:hypothetical protein
MLAARLIKLLRNRKCFFNSFLTLKNLQMLQLMMYIWILINTKIIDHLLSNLLILLILFNYKLTKTYYYGNKKLLLF